MTAPIIKWKTCYQNKIEPVEVTRETDASVFFMRTIRAIKPRSEERREAKRGEYWQYHDSWAEAHLYLLTRAEAKIKDARRELELRNAALGNIKGMKPPKA